jgi:hypothetical protein
LRTSTGQREPDPQRATGGWLLEGRAIELREDAELNPHLDESKNARNYVGQIDGILPQAKCGA